MKRNWWWKAGAAASLIALTGACAEDLSEGPQGPDSTEDGISKVVDGKADAWNWRNDPRNLRMEFDYNFENLPNEGASDRIGWAASYWPYYKDGINQRWQGNDVLSPAEKWDKAFKGWEPEDGFMDLKRYDSSTCEWDDEYYAQLGPAASWTDRNKGNWMSHNGVDDDDDGVEDKDECGFGENKDNDGVESWWGICHAWAPAAIMEDEPLKPVTRNGVEFGVSDLKALLIQQYDRTSAIMVGGRCNEKELERDDNGRIIKSECRDLNAGSWHVIITNLLGKNSRPFVIERTTNYEIWNQPLVGYKITEQREITLDEAHALLDLSADELDGGNGTLVHGVEEESFLAQAMLKFVNTASRTELDEDASLSSTAVDSILTARPVATLAALDEVPNVGEGMFARIQEYVESKDLVQKPGYHYNPDATRFVEVHMTTDWVTESQPRAEPTTPINDRYMRHDRYQYVLELDDAGEIIGGEWVGSSNTRHPDFVWLPVAARGGNPHLDIRTIREMIAESRKTDDGGDDTGGDDASGTKRYASSDEVEIPDNDLSGVGTVLEVPDSGVVRSVKIDLDIAHTYRGDLRVELVHGGVSVTVFNGADASQPWTDDVKIEGQELDGFLGSQLEGMWELRVVDSARIDTGSIKSWKLEIETN